MKIKVRPEDFIVEEIANFKLTNKGKYYLYKLHKTGWNTIDALRKLAKNNNIAYKKISYCGKKDRYAKTVQFITIDRKIDKEKLNENVFLTFEGMTDFEAAPSNILGNRFCIKLRDIEDKKIDLIKQRVDKIREFGFPNYFGDQRFGSYDRNLGFFGEKLLKGHYNGALKCLLCSIHSEDSKEEKERKRFFFQNWGHFDKLLENAKREIERKIFSILKEKPKGYLEAIHEYPIEEISMGLSAYQSFLWNNMLSKFIEPIGNLKIPIKGWLYPSYRELRIDDLKYLKDLELPTHGIKPGFVDKRVEDIYNMVLVEEGLYQERFSMRKYRKVIVKSFMRKAIIIPEDLKILSISNDDIYKGKKSITISFILPRGSFATVLIKHLC
ncbi:MAG: tRNA pseudouridine(13) synthase TruD [Proteobacteria bacterium]|nr:tRNA pseudouridine(13) synthase TruD [Pseudomonadota bacterium]